MKQFVSIISKIRLGLIIPSTSCALLLGACGGELVIGEKPLNNNGEDKLSEDGDKMLSGATEFENISLEPTVSEEIPLEPSVYENIPLEPTVFVDGSAMGGATGSNSACEAMDAELLEDWEEIRDAPNEFGALSDSAWSGYIDSGADVTLTLGANGNGKLILGDETVELPAPQMGGPFLCNEYRNSDCEDGVLGYPFILRGAKFENRRFQVTVEAESAWEEFCDLHTSVPLEQVGLVCHFEPAPVFQTDGEGADLGVDVDGNQCFHHGQRVNCEWYDMAVNAGICDCSSDACFPSVDTLLDFEFDLTLSENGQELVGSLGGVKRVQLFRAD